jgi:hypothetical protein
MSGDRWYYAIYRDDEHRPIKEGEIRARSRDEAEREILCHVPDDQHGIILEPIVDESEESMSGGGTAGAGT